MPRGSADQSSRGRLAVIAAALEGRKKSLALAVFAAALVVRLLFIWETRDVVSLRTPTPGLDTQVNWEAARALRGEIPSAPSFELAMLSAPLYPYWLAADQAVLGEAMSTHRIAGAVLGALRFVLLFFVFLRLSERAWAALAASLLLLTLPSLIYFDTVPIKAATDITLLSLLLAALVFWERPASAAWTAVRALACGALVVAAFLSQLNTFLYVVPVIAFVAANRAWARAQRALFVGAVLALFGFAFAAYQLRSTDAAGDGARFVPRAGVDLRIGFQPGATGSYQQIPGISPWPYGHAFEARMLAELATAERMSWAESDRYYRNLALGYLRDHPGAAARLLLRKAAYFANDLEVRGTHYLYYLDDHSRVLRWSPVSFGWLFVLGALGIFALVAERRWRALLLFGGLTVCVLFANCLAIVEWRFRLPVTVLLAALAGPGLLHAVHLVRAARAVRAETVHRWSYLRLAGFVATALLAGWLTFRQDSPYPHELSMKRSAENATLSAAAERAQRDLEEVERELHEDPANATLREKRVRLLRNLRRHSEAYAALKEIHASGNGSAWAYVQFMRYLLWLGHYDEASSILEDLRRQHPSHYLAVRNQSGTLERKVIEMFILPEGQRAGRPLARPPGGPGSPWLR